jgi:carboxymethylenebutenolidase
VIVAAMKERLVDIPTPSGAMETFVAHPQENAPFPAVVVFMDVWGLREELFDIARRIATVGYYCLVPNFYYRQGKIRHEFRDQGGRMITLDKLDRQTQEAVLAPSRKLSDAMVVEDTGSLLAFLEQGEPVRIGAMGCIGYCMGGRHVFRAAANFPQRFRASASLHGTNLVTERADSPHLSAKNADGELYCGFGEKDRFTPPATVHAIENALRGCKVRFRHEVHDDADHGYALPDRDVYDKRAANRDWELIFQMFHRQIPCASKPGK